MNTRLFIAAAIACTGLIFSCSNNRTSGISTPIDSVNAGSTSPVEYTSGDPASPIDTTRQARDQYSQDTLGRRAGATPPAGTGTNTSNTTDARTTAGSANAGDADGDRKK